MHNDFLTRKPNMKCSYDTYRNVVNSMNISFTKHGQEKGEECIRFAQKYPEHATENDPKYEDCQSILVHLERAKQAGDEYKRHINTSKIDQDTSYYSADLQKVIMLPRMDTLKTVMFTRSIIVFNESFVPLAGTNNDDDDNGRSIAVIWHEVIAGRKQEDLIPAFLPFFLKKMDKKKIFLWLDNCAAQNKNWTLLSFITYLVNSDEVATEEIQLNYFEKGHTLILADSFYHQVELSLKIKRMCMTLMFSRTLLRSSKTLKCGFPTVEKRTRVRGIPQEKKEDIIKTLFPLMSKNRLKFWTDIEVSDVPDLVHSYEM
ncbi:hypothetical protein PR048_006378 [Dryococelus australis]|uniref:DUF7869 domain-containing protein n=1 Tax=Dryococelus australis TaxID=614101 RepID=A0ABQ9IAU0_9NEOP|nr:hypothetical protein PR048_006378 [Dryococelus australis]